jgi:NhaP-type Na+/H+ or K+/H+ antiporter
MKIPFTKCVIKPCCPSLKIPTFLGMLIMGCVGRNFVSEDIEQNFPDVWTGWIRIVCLCHLLLRGGMEISFKGQGIIVLLLAVGPQIFEATAVGLAARALYGMPWPLAFAFGFVLGAVSPAVVVPSLLSLQERGYGVTKRIPTTLIAASAFDDIIAITLFSILASVTFAMEGFTEEGAHADMAIWQRILFDLG